MVLKSFLKIWPVNIFDLYQGPTFSGYPQSRAVSVRDCFHRKEILCEVMDIMYEKCYSMFIFYLESISCIDAEDNHLLQMNKHQNKTKSYT